MDVDADFFGRPFLPLCRSHGLAKRVHMAMPMSLVHALLIACSELVLGLN